MTESLDERLRRSVGATHTIERELTGGGMSRVFVAHERALKRDVVLKLLPPELITAASTARFTREIELTAALQHPHILPVLSAGADGDLLYYFTPFVRAESLRERLKTGPLTATEAIRLTTELLSAVAYAHGQGVVHRDIKPGNVLVSGGHAMLADFGIARALGVADDGIGPSAGSTLAGGLAYSAPERDRGAAADLFSVAALAHEMLLGVPGVANAPAPQMGRALHEAHPALGVTRAQQVARVIAAGLSTDIGARPRDASQFRDMLVAAATPPVRATRYVAAVSGLAAVALIAVIASRPAPVASEATPALSTASARPEAEAGAEVDGPEQVGASAPASEARLTPRPPASLEDSAAEAYAAGRLTDAIGLYTTIETRTPNNARAPLTIALAWIFTGGQPDAEPLRAAAERAVARRAALSPPDAALADAAAAFSRREFDAACSAFERARALGAPQLEAWLGIAECHALDDVVLPADSARPARFRSSFATAARAYTAAIRAVPKGAPPFVFRRLDQVMYLQPNRVRRGQSADGRVWFARPAVSGDTVAFVPFDPRERRGPPDLAAEARATALFRAQLRPLYMEWIRVAPSQPAAHDAMAVLLESAGQVNVAGADGITALSANARARALADDASLRTRLTRDRIRLLVRAAQWTEAGRLADSLVAAHPAPDPQDLTRLLGPAALAGRVRATTSMLADASARPDRAVRLADARVVELPIALLRERAEFNVRAALGLCDDRVRGGPARIMQLLDTYVGEAGRPQGVEWALFDRPFGAAITCLGVGASTMVRGATSPPIRAAQALARGDTAQARGLLAAMDQQRSAQPGLMENLELMAGDVGVRLALGDTATVVRILTRMLDLVPVAPPTIVEQETSAAILVRSMGLLAELEHAGGNTEIARRWAGAVVALWRGADEELQPFVARMQAIAGRAP